MPRWLILALLLASTGLALAEEPPPSDEPDRPFAERLEQVKPGMAAGEVRRLLGPPRSVARQILYRRHFELWRYDGPPQLRIEFHGVRGEEARVGSVQWKKPLPPIPFTP